MSLPNIFSPSVSQDIIKRIQQLRPDSTPLWGKMSVSQMLAHCCVTYEYVYDNKHPKPGFMQGLLLKWFVKGKVIGEAPYSKSGPTGPDFIISDSRDFEVEKARLIAYIERTQKLGESYFEGRESHSFGKLTAQEWNNMFYKHLNHHLEQFGV